jgi:hypothetical protein
MEERRRGELICSHAALAKGKMPKRIPKRTDTDGIRKIERIIPGTAKTATFPFSKI